MKSLKLTLIVAVTIMALMLISPMATAQDEKVVKTDKEKVALKNFFNSLGELAVLDDAATEKEGSRAAANLIRSLGYLAEESTENSPEERIIIRDLFMDISNIVEAGEDSDAAAKSVGKLMRSFGKLSVDKSGNIHSSKMFNLIAKAIETNGFEGNERLEKEFVKELFNTLGDIVTEFDDEDEDDEK